MKNEHPSHSFRQIFSWAIYDFANTIFSMNVVTMYFSLWITVNLAREDFWVSVGNSASMLLVALSLPILGAISDSVGRRIPYLFIFTIGSVLGTALIGMVSYWVPNGVWQLAFAVLCFIVANYAFQGALVFYNALLPQISTPRTIGRISGLGVSMGYLGAIIGLLMVMPFAQGEITFLHFDIPFLQKDWQQVQIIEAASLQTRVAFLDTSIDKNANYKYKLVPKMHDFRSATGWKLSSKDTVIENHHSAKRAIQVRLPGGKKWSTGSLVLLRKESGWGRRGTFIPTAVLFFLFSLPTFIFIREKVTPRPAGRVRLKEAISRVMDGITNTRKYPGVLRFLLAKFFYEEGIQTAIIFMAVYAVKVMGFPNEKIILFFMVTTTAAAIGSLLFGYITDRLNPKPTLMIVISGWVLSLMAIILTTNTTIFWVIGSVIGILMGSTWTAARPLLVTLVPPEMLAEFFGLYSLSGKVAAIFGPLVWGGTVLLLKPYGDVIRYKGAVFSLALMMLLGLFLLWKVPARTFEKQNSFGE